MYRLTNAFPYLLNRVGVRMGELFSRRLEAHGITLPMYRVLAALWEKGDRRLGELGDVCSIEISTLSRLVGTLSRKGLVHRRRLDANARVVEINLTKAGRVLAERLIPIAVHHEEVGLHGLKPAEIARLRQSLTRVLENLSTLENEVADGDRRDAKQRVRS